MSDKLSAADYKWEELNRDRRSVFDMFVNDPNRPNIVNRVVFDEDTFSEMDYFRNRESFTYYGSGRIHEYEAVLLDDGSILFCIVSGSRFAGTFSPSDPITMRYYKLTKV